MNLNLTSSLPFPVLDLQKRLDSLKRNQDMNGMIPSSKDPHHQFDDFLNRDSLFAVQYTKLEFYSILPTKAEEHNLARQCHN